MKWLDFELKIHWFVCKMMQSLSIKKTYPNDFDKIYPLLLDFHSPYTRDDWKEIFEYQWDGCEDYIGFHLEHDDYVVGFMGLVFSRRFINGVKYNFCNITSLIVKPDYRVSTIFFIRKLMELRDYIFTGFSPIEASWQLFKKIGFVPFENRRKIIPVFNFIFSSVKEMNFCEMPEILERVDPENRRILNDHNHKKCSSILFELNEKSCVLIYKLETQKHLGITVNKILVIYVSNLNFFNNHLNAVLKVFLKKFYFFSALYIDSRFVINSARHFSITKEVFPPRICTGSLDGIHIDGLYSEVILL